MFAQILKQWFWDCYDHLGRLVVANLLAVFLLGGAGLFSFAFVTSIGGNAAPAGAVILLAAWILLAGPILLAAWFSSLGFFAGLASAEKDPGLRILATGLYRHFGRCWRYFLLCLLIQVVLMVNVWFYSVAGLLPEGMKMPGMLLAGFCFWLTLLVLVAMLAGIPGLIRQERRAWSALRTGFLILFRHPGVTIGLFIFLVSLWIIGFSLRFAGVILFGFSGTVMLLNSFHDVLMELEDRQEKAAAETGSNRPRTWKELQVVEKSGEEDRMKRSRYERTFRDILRPWEG